MVVKYFLNIYRSVCNRNQEQQNLQRCSICLTNNDNDYILDLIVCNMYLQTTNIVISRPSDVRSKIQEHHANGNLISLYRDIIICLLFCFLYMIL